jgi:MFS transporter, ACDE family, multidrug resistance protein
VLMSVAFIAIFVLLPTWPKPAHHTTVLDPLRALRHRGLLTMGLTALCYNFGFFTLLGYAPFPLRLDAHGLGFVFFGWGVLLAITSVFAAPRLQSRFGTTRTLYVMLSCIALDLLIMGLAVDSQITLIVCVIVAGAFLGVNNTLVTTAVMEVAPVERPIASAAYSFVRFIGGAIAPYLAGKLAERYSPHIPFYVGAGAVCLSLVVLYSGRHLLAAVDRPAEPEDIAEGEDMATA